MARRPRRNSDAIRIVPLIGTAVAARAVPAAHLTNRNGPLLTAVEITTIFWGSWWKTAPQDALVGRLNAFFDDILVSALIDQLKEYSVPGKSIGHGRRTSTLTVDTSPATTVDDSAIVAFLEGLLAAGSVPKASRYQCSLSAICLRTDSRCLLTLIQRITLDRSSFKGSDNISALKVCPMVNSTPGLIHKAPPSTLTVV